MTNPLGPGDFAKFFQALWGQKPFPWQARLAADLVEHGWPPALNLPTSAGKTAAIDAAVFHLAIEADRGSARKAPLRIVFVVDRRLVVDDAFRRAQQIAEKLARAKDGMLKLVADRLRPLAGPDEPPLRAVRLRGGMPLEPDWARSPCQPTICVSTVNQVGSRLLFRGYGVSQSMRPVHAGLLGADALFLLDEAHLSQPFSETLGWITRYRNPPWVEETGVPFTIVPLSATLSESAPQAFSLSKQDLTNADLKARLLARKHTRLVRLKKRLEDGYDPISDDFAAAAIELSPISRGNDDVQIVAVVVNRVGLARAIYNSLQRRLADRSLLSEQALLLIGRTRDLDREALLARMLPRMQAQGRQDGPLLFVVATQCIEAGADLDFDALVSQIAPLDCLRQRFGRLDRLGRRGASEAVILAAADELGKRAEDPIYGRASAQTWEWLNSVTIKEGSRKFVDFGANAMGRHLSAQEATDAQVPPEDRLLPNLLAPRKSAPVMLPAYVDIWAQTSPAPAADPEPALFLHGPESGPADVEIIWRADISTAGMQTEDAAALLSALPPSSLEALSVPIWAARAWLSNMGAVDFGDLEGTAAAPVEWTDEAPTSVAFRWRGMSEEQPRFVRAREVLPGDIIVVPAEAGGCDEYGWNPQARIPVRDLGEEAALQQRRRLVVRLLRPVVNQCLHFEARTETEDNPDAARLLWARVADAVAAEPDDDRALMGALLDLDSLPRSLRARVEILYHLKTERLNLPQERGCLLTARRPLTVAMINRLLRDPNLSDTARDLLQDIEAPVKPGEPATESDHGSFLGREITLAAHSAGVRDFAREFATRAGLNTQLVECIALAGYVHDVGKAEPRFQAWLHGGDEISAAGLPPLAKSGGRFGTLVERRAARTRAGFPSGARHECWSVRLAENHPDLLSLTDDERDLVLWLVGTHHGWGRPLFPPITDPDPSGAVEFELNGEHLTAAVDHGLTCLDSGWIERFERLKHRFGPWELAHLEAILRLADHRRSEAEQEGSVDDES